MPADLQVPAVALESGRPQAGGQEALALSWLSHRQAGQLGASPSISPGLSFLSLYEMKDV